MHRKLAEQSRSYREIVDNFRRGEAERHLQAADPQLAQLALSLGFADHSAFSRAFKRWTGVSPSDWRKHHPRLI